MRICQCYHFSVGERTIGGFDDVYTEGDESSRQGFEYGGTERSSALSGGVGTRELNDEPHAIASCHNRLLSAAQDPDGPRRKLKRGCGWETGFHDGSESFNASRFFVTMASPFLVETSMPVAHTV